MRARSLVVCTVCTQSEDSAAQTRGGADGQSDTEGSDASSGDSSDEAPVQDDDVVHEDTGGGDADDDAAAAEATDGAQSTAEMGSSWYAAGVGKHCYSHLSLQLQATVDGRALASGAGLHCLANTHGVPHLLTVTCRFRRLERAWGAWHDMWHYPYAKHLLTWGQVGELS
jgi:hypothetical protein